jgi:hypothetical protein
MPQAGKAGLIAAAIIVLCLGGAAVAGTANKHSTVDGGAPAQDTRVTEVPTTAAPASATPSPSDSASSPSDPASSAVPLPSATPNVTKQSVTETQAIPFGTRKVNDATLAKGSTKVRTAGVDGVRSLTYEVTYTDGVQTGKVLVGSVVTRQPVTQVVAVGTKVTQKCDPNYSGACVPIASDVDCAGGSGNGPAYVQGPVRVIGRDIYGLDNDGDGIGCES